MKKKTKTKTTKRTKKQRPKLLVAVRSPFGQMEIFTFKSHRDLCGFLTDVHALGYETMVGVEHR